MRTLQAWPCVAAICQSCPGQVWQLGRPWVLCMPSDFFGCSQRWACGTGLSLWALPQDDHPHDKYRCTVIEKEQVRGSRCSRRQSFLFQKLTYTGYLLPQSPPLALCRFHPPSMEHKDVSQNEQTFCWYVNDKFVRQLIRVLDIQADYFVSDTPETQ